MKRLVTTEHTVRCPLEDCAATVTVRSDPDAAPSRRHRDVLGCSLRPPAPYVPPATLGYFADVAPPVSYVRDVAPGPCHAQEPACSKVCLGVLNAAEPGAGDPGDSVHDLVMKRLLWIYGS
jgi:hypothetical protein